MGLSCEAWNHCFGFMSEGPLHSQGLRYVHRFQPDPIKQWNMFFLKKCKKTVKQKSNQTKKQIKKQKKSKTKTKKTQKKSNKKTKKTKAKAKGTHKKQNFKSQSVFG